MFPTSLVFGATIVFLLYIAKRLYDAQERYPSHIPIIEPVPGTKNEDVIKAQYAKGPLTKNINRMLDKIYGEIDRVLQREVGNGAGRVVNVDFLTTEVYLHVFEMVLVGDDLGHDEEWLRIFADYPRVAFNAAVRLAKYHWLVRPVVARLIPEMRGLLDYRQEVYDILRPFHQERLQAMQTPDFKEPDDYIQSFINHAGAERGNTWRLAESISGTSMAGIQTTARVLYQTLFDLVQYPEYLGPIREEINHAISQEGGSANLSQAGLLSLVKLDSFIKESQKFHYNNLVSSNRKLFRSLTLSDGTVIPKNAYVSIPGLAHAVIDKTGNTRPFDGFQWAEKKLTAENPSVYNYVFSGQDDLEFGAGLHACPGRWFASIALKSALVRILLRYDFRLPEGQKRPVDEYNDGLEMEHDVTATLEFLAREHC
ncbi:cytochrome P450 [Aspergillus clavatus NRRL 1]|uniref:Cytochrome P450 oxidoreductase, putative n=1 Tax=Aspergillus clavatus (strain ATCC 1007 / CBS 513.65 / DSM 816 / NCTC 3887 / NRRL 1 / QM 1276 / 107) TaxID=344612 RepID=A1CM76_ASPCL|nr:Cytochrome P450 oxidoreductase, putative [Aspergillus clavatus NRRL 1]EAW08663.1 Cytochrome P450 oxidoreductase, putative [Aspergillus clavatus NRRL 1]